MRTTRLALTLLEASKTFRVPCTAGRTSSRCGSLEPREGAGGRHVEDARGAGDGCLDGMWVEWVGFEEGEAGGGAGEGEEVGGVGALLEGVEDGIALVEEGSDKPQADEVIGSRDADRL
ncbi:hypothetical protein AAC387_Pa03g2731 [Persea americana]